MTIAQLKETLLGKVFLELGVFGDGTVLDNNLLQKYRELCHSWEWKEVVMKFYIME